MSATIVKLTNQMFFARRPYMVVYEGGCFGMFDSLRSAARAVRLIKSNPELLSK